MHYVLPRSPWPCSPASDSHLWGRCHSPSQGPQEIYSLLAVSSCTSITVLPGAGSTKDSVTIGNVVQPHAALLLPSDSALQPALGMLLLGWIVPEHSSLPTVDRRQPSTCRAGWTQGNGSRQCSELRESNRVAAGKEAQLLQCLLGQERGFQQRCCHGAAEPGVQVLLALGNGPPAQSKSRC